MVIKIEFYPCYICYNYLAKNMEHSGKLFRNVYFYKNLKFD